MKPLKVKVQNFASYKELEFNFAELGLILIHGATGSGKSTLEDIIPWILYGQTAKGGSVDEIRSWTNTEEPTIGSITLETSQGQLFITRVRGKPNQNDLLYSETRGEPIRGKDITETQKLIEQRLGVSAELYLTAAYFNEFSETGRFFTNNAKTKRQLFENIANLNFAIKLAERASNEKRIIRTEILKKITTKENIIGRIDNIVQSISDCERRVESFIQNIHAKTDQLRQKSQNFEKEKLNIIKELEHKRDEWCSIQTNQKSMLLININQIEQELLKEHECCKECGEPNKQYRGLKEQLTFKRNRLELLAESKNPHLPRLEFELNATNPYPEQIEAERCKINPFIDQLDKLNKDLESYKVQKTNLEVEIQKLEYKLNLLNQIYDLSFELRGQLLKRSIQEIQDQTNNYLGSYFDAEIKVTFSVEDADKLQVQIQKSGYDCSYTQLSKGQRCMLKLCFSVSVMKAAANKVGVHMDLLAFDEALDGLDSEFKQKAFGLFNELSLDHSSIIVIEHSSELKSLFNKQYYIELLNDMSYIKKCE